MDNRSPHNQTILLDIYQRLGAIESKLELIEKLEVRIEKLKTDVDENTEFRTRIAAYVWVGGSIASGVVFFLVEGVKYWLDKVSH